MWADMSGSSSLSSMNSSCCIFLTSLGEIGAKALASLYCACPDGCSILDTPVILIGGLGDLTAPSGVSGKVFGTPDDGGSSATASNAEGVAPVEQNG